MKVLIVEDHPDMRELLRLFLESLYYVPVLASHGKEGVDKAIMCGRFTASFEYREIKLLLTSSGIPLLTPRFNIAPSQEVPVIIHNNGVNELKPMKWGLVPGRPIDLLVTT